MEPIAKPAAKHLRRPWWMAALLTVAGALFLVGVAGAANSQSFTDRAGDAGLALDITGLDVSNDDAGTITFRVTVAGGRPIGLPGDELGVALDLNQNPDTGTAYYGTEVAFAFEEDKVQFFHADGSNFAPAPLPPRCRGRSAMVSPPSQSTPRISASRRLLASTSLH